MLVLDTIDENDFRHAVHVEDEVGDEYPFQFFADLLHFGGRAGHEITNKAERNVEAESNPETPAVPVRALGVLDVVDVSVTVVGWWRVN